MLVEKIIAAVSVKKQMSPTVDINPLTLFIVWHCLQRICREMRRVIEATSQSYLFSRLKDVSVGIWVGEGRTISIPATTATHRATQASSSMRLGSGWRLTGLAEADDGISSADVCPAYLLDPIAREGRTKVQRPLKICRPSWF